METTQTETRAGQGARSDEAAAMMPESSAPRAAAPTTRGGRTFQLPARVTHRPITIPELTADFVTVLRDPRGRPANKVIDLRPDGTWSKEAVGARRGTYVARTAHVPTSEALAALERELGPDEFLICGWVPGTEDGRPFGVVSEEKLSGWLSQPERSWPLGMFRVPEVADDLWVVGRFKENWQHSTWVPFDADAHPEMPEALRWTTPAEWWDRMVAARLLPADALRVVVRSASNRVAVEGRPVFAGSSCRTYVLTEPTRQTPRLWERSLMVLAHLAGVGWMKASRSAATGKVVSSTPASIFDPVVLRTPVQPEFDGAPALGSGAEAAGAEVLGADVTPAGAKRWDTSGLRVDEEKLSTFTRQTGVRASLHRHGKAVRVAWVKEDLRLDLAIQTEAGEMTVEQFWRSPLDHTRAQVPAEFRESKSENAYLGRHRDGVPFLFDNGPGEKHVLPRGAREAFEETLAREQVQAMPIAERRARWPEVVAPLAPEARARVVKWLADDAEMDAGVKALQERLRPYVEALDGQREADRAALAADAEAAGRVRVVYSETRIAEVAREVAAEMVSNPARFPVYVRTGEGGTEYVYVKQRDLPFTHGLGDDKPPPVLSINPLAHATLIEKLEPCVQLVQQTKGGPRPLPMRPDVRLQILGMEEKPGRKILGVVGHPLVMPDGKVIATEGLHEGLAIYLDLGGVDFGEIRPLTREEARAARLRVRELMLAGTFPASPLDEEICAMAFPMTGLVRKVVESAPNALLTASEPKCGKTKAAARLGTIITGHSPPFTRWPSSDDEMEKRVGAILRHGAEALIFDNVENGLTIRSAFIAQMTTGRSANLRVLGESEVVVVAATFMVVTGNNLLLAQDEVSRFLECRLTAPPEGYQYQHDAVPHAKRIRAEVVRLLLGIISGFLRSGEAMSAPSRYQDAAGWDRMVRQPILWAGGLDVAEVFTRNEEQSDELHARNAAIEELRAYFGCKDFSAGETVDAATFSPALREALEGLRANIHESRSVGRALASLKDVITSDRRSVLRRLGTRSRYRVEDWQPVSQTGSTVDADLAALLA